jgi:hypothetical protein
LSLFLLLLCGLVLAGGIAFSLNAGLAFFSPRATITITPRSSFEQQSITVKAVTGTPGQGEIQVRTLQARTSTEHATVPATGSGHQDAQPGRGQVTFYNLATYEISIPAGVLLTGRDGIQVMTDDPAQVPAGNPPTLGAYTVHAHTVRLGPTGNIAAGDIDVLCCANGIVAKNQQPFSGGQEARSYTAVVQQDIDSASAPLITTLTRQAQADLQAQARPGERLTQARCSPHVLADPAVGQESTQSTVTVWVSCNSAAYNQQQIDSLAATLLQQQVSAALGTHYALSGRIATGDAQLPLSNAQGILSLLVPAQGLWVYQLDQQALHDALKQLVGKPQRTAQAQISSLPGVLQVTIQIAGGDGHTLPTAFDQITVIVVTPHTA